MNRSAIIGAAAVFAVIGIVLILESPEMGLRAANSWLRGVGGSADTSTFNLMASGKTEAYRTIGALLLGGGLFGFFIHVGRLFSTPGRSDAES